jgi:GTP-binding protein
MARPIVALVGRPNVGKSTLFNRLVGAQVAVVHETPGTTRDRLYGTVDWRGRSIALVDTGGIGLDESGELQQSILDQAQAAMHEADVIVFLTDARSGPLPSDVEIANQLRRSSKPVILVANKADNRADQLRAADMFELGLDEPVIISSTQGTGTGDLLDRVVDALPPPAVEDDDADVISVAIVGRPNVGKSSLLNAIVGEQRVIVNPMPGTTRDAIDTPFERDGRQFILIDTAGIRRRGRIERGIETYSVLRAMRAAERADIAILVVDADAGIAAQDAHVAGYAHDAAKGIVIAVNKWDLIERAPDAGARYLASTRRALGFLDYAPVLFVSAKSGLNVGRLLDRVVEVHEQRGRRIPTAQFNEFIRGAAAAHPLTDRGRALKILYATQASTHPPTFVLFVNDPTMVHFSYRRYLENQIRRQFGFDGSGIKLIFRGRTGEH